MIPLNDNDRLEERMLAVLARLGRSRQWLARELGMFHKALSKVVVLSKPLHNPRFRPKWKTRRERVMEWVVQHEMKEPT